MNIADTLGVALIAYVAVCIIIDLIFDNESTPKFINTYVPLTITAIILFLIDGLPIL